MKEQIWIPYERISANLVRAVIAGEDIHFFRHSGVDFIAIHAAVRQDWNDKEFTRGASTINQQLAKNLFLSSSKTIVRKLHEAIIAWEMDSILGKRRILELYLNILEWGAGIYGAEAAARHYFNISAAMLNVEQAAFLATIIPTPLVPQNPSAPSHEIQARINKIQLLMRHPLLDSPLVKAEDF